MPKTIEFIRPKFSGNTSSHIFSTNSGQPLLISLNPVCSLVLLIMSTRLVYLLKVSKHRVLIFCRHVYFCFNLSFEPDRLQRNGPRMSSWGLLDSPSTTGPNLPQSGLKFFFLYILVVLNLAVLILPGLLLYPFRWYSRGHFTIPIFGFRFYSDIFKLKSSSRSPVSAGCCGDCRPPNVESCY